jgi:ATP-binding cassette, subfamily C, bacterial
MNQSSMFRTLRFYAGYRLRLAKVVGLQFVASFADNLSILALLPIIQAMTAGGSPTWIGTLLTDIVTFFGLPADIRGFLALMLLAAVVKAALSYKTTRVGNWLVLDIVSEVRTKLLRGFIGLRWSQFARLKSGDWVSLQVTEVERFRPGLVGVLTLATSSLQALFYFGAALLVSWKLTLLAVVLGLFKVVTLRHLRRAGFSIGAEYSESVRSMTVGLLEGLQNIKAIRAMGADSALFSRQVADAKNNRRAVDNVYKNATQFSTADDLVTSVILVVVLFICAVYLAVDVSELAIVGLLMSRILVQIGNVIKGQHTVALTASIGMTIEGRLQQFRTEAESGSGTREIRLRKALQFDNVALGYDDRTVVKDVRLSIPAGSFCAFIGASGGGKTTLVDAVIGLVAPWQGRVTVDGVDLAEANLTAWRRHIGYVPQELVLFNDSVRSNIVFGRDGITEDDVRRALKDAEALDFVEAMPQGLDTPVGERGTALSGGQRQRLALARALVHSPDLLILDEATTALDPATEIEICRTLRRLAGQRTILAISHQPRIAEIADLVVEVSDGTARVMSAEPAKVAAI